MVQHQASQRAFAYLQRMAGFSGVWERLGCSRLMAEPSLSPARPLYKCLCSDFCTHCRAQQKVEVDCKELKEIHCRRTLSKRPIKIAKEKCDFLQSLFWPRYETGQSLSLIQKS